MLQTSPASSPEELALILRSWLSRVRLRASVLSQTESLISDLMSSDSIFSVRSDRALELLDLSRSQCCLTCIPRLFSYSSTALWFIRSGDSADWLDLMMSLLFWEESLWLAQPVRGLLLPPHSLASLVEPVLWTPLRLSLWVVWFSHSVYLQVLVSPGGLYFNNYGLLFKSAGLSLRLWSVLGS